MPRACYAAKAVSDNVRYRSRGFERPVMEL